jgi:hypothetical protein
MSSILKGIINEGISAQDLADVLYNRLTMRYPDVVSRYGHEVVGDIVSDVASFHEGAEELGTSDIGGMIRQIIRKLENYNIDEAVDPAQQTVYAQVKGLVDQLDKRGKQNVSKALKKNLGIVTEEDEVNYDDKYQSMVKRVGQMAKEGPRKTVWDPVKKVYKTVPAGQPKTDDNFQAYLAQRKAAKQGVDEGWKEETAEHDEFLQHARQQLQNASVMERIRLAQRLSKLEQKHFPEMFRAEDNGISSSISGIVNSIEHSSQQPNSNSTQMPFGRVTTPNKPISDPEPLRPNNDVRPTSKPEKPMLNVLQGDDVNWTNPQYAHLFPDDEQDDEEDKSKPFNWKEFIAMGLIAIKIPGIASGMVKDFKERFGVDMSIKDIFKYAMHVFRTKEEIHPAQWKFEQEGGDYENAVDQIPADQDEQVPAQAVFDTMASTLAPATAGNDAFANMVNHLGKKEEAEIEKKLSESLGYKSIKENAGNPPAFYTKCKTCGTPYNKHFRFDSNGKILSSLVRHPTMKDDFPGMDGMSVTKPTRPSPEQLATMSQRWDTEGRPGAMGMRPSKPLEVGDIIGVRPAGAKMIPTKAEVLSVGRSSALVKLLSPRAVELRNGNAEMTISTIGGQDIQNPYVPVTRRPEQGVAEGYDSEELANEVYAEFERIYPNLARRAHERTIHAAIMDVLNYGGDNNPGALAQDVARAVKQQMQQGVAEGLVGNVVVHNYTKMPIKLKPGQAQIHGWGPEDQPIYRVMGADGKEVITSNKRKMIQVAQGQGVAEEKIKGADGKACWPGYRYNGTENGKDSCVKVKETKSNILKGLMG